MNRSLRQSREALYQGLIKLAEGNWAEAEAQLLASMRGAEKPLISFLGAACVNQGQGNLEKRDEYLAAVKNIKAELKAAKAYGKPLADVLK